MVVHWGHSVIGSRPEKGKQGWWWVVGDCAGGTSGSFGFRRAGSSLWRASSRSEEKKRSDGALSDLGPGQTGPI